MFAPDTQVAYKKRFANVSRHIVAPTSVRYSDMLQYSVGVQVHAPAAGPPLHSGGPQKLRQFLAVSGLPLTAVIKSFLKGLFIIDNS